MGSHTWPLARAANPAGVLSGIRAWGGNAVPEPFDGVDLATPAGAQLAAYLLRTVGQGLNLDDPRMRARARRIADGRHTDGDVAFLCACLDIAFGPIVASQDVADATAAVVEPDTDEVGGA